MRLLALLLGLFCASPAQGGTAAAGDARKSDEAELERVERQARARIGELSGGRQAPVAPAQAPAHERVEPPAPEPAQTPAPEPRPPEEAPDQAESPKSAAAVEAADAMNAKGESSFPGAERDAADEQLSLQEKHGLSDKLIREGQESTYKEVFKDSVMKAAKHFSTRTRLERRLGIKKFNWVGPVKIIDSIWNLSDTLDTMDKLMRSRGGSTWNRETAASFGLAAVWEFRAPMPIKIIYGAGQIIVGGSKIAYDEFMDNYHEARVNRLLIGKGGFWEHYASFRSRGTTPFYLWGVAKERGLKEDLSNLTEVFETPSDLKAAWGLYVNFMLDFGGREGGAVREEFDRGADRARDALLEEWAEQVKIELIQRVKEYTDREMPEVEESMAELLAEYRHAMRTILDAHLEPFTIRGKARGVRPSSLKDRRLYLMIGGKGLEKEFVIRVFAKVHDDGTYSAVVRGFMPGMTTVNGYLMEKSRPFKPAALPLFPRLFRAFDRFQWDAVQRPPDTITLDLDFGKDPGDECADLDPGNKTLEKGQYYAAAARHEKCLKEGRAAVDGRRDGRGRDSGSDDAAAIASCVSQLASLPKGCQTSYAIENAHYNAITCGKNGWVNFGTARPGSRMDKTLYTVDIDKDCRKRLLNCAAQKRFPCAGPSPRR